MRSRALTLFVSIVLAGLLCAQEKQIYDAGGDVKAPQVIHSVLPQFTEKSRETQVSGPVLVGLVVNEEGDPENVQVKKGIEKDLDEKAVEAVKQWKFKPGTKENKPVAVRVSIEIHFKRL